MRAGGVPAPMTMQGVPGAQGRRDGCGASLPRVARGSPSDAPVACPPATWLREGNQTGAAREEQVQGGGGGTRKNITESRRGHASTFTEALGWGSDAPPRAPFRDPAGLFGVIVMNVMQMPCLVAKGLCATCGCAVIRGSARILGGRCPSFVSRTFLAPIWTGGHLSIRITRHEDAGISPCDGAGGQLYSRRIIEKDAMMPHL